MKNKRLTEFLANTNSNIYFYGICDKTEITEPTKIYDSWEEIAKQATKEFTKEGFVLQ